MKVVAMGKTFDVKRVINEVSPACKKCGKETKDCVKLYRRTVSIVSMCVELV